MDQKQSAIHLVDKILRFGAFGLPESVLLSDQTELLAGPAQVLLTAGQEEFRFTPNPPTVTLEGNNVRVTALASASTSTTVLALETKARVDYDGFIETKLRIRPTAGRHFTPEKISRLSLRIPIRREIARYIHRVLVQEISALDGYGFQGTDGPIWVGNQEGGLAFSHDTALFFSKDLRRQIRVIEDPDRVWLELNLVDGPDQLHLADGQTERDGVILRFFLQPTPTRPAPKHTYNPWVSSKWELWSDWQGYPDLKKIPEIKQWASGLVRAGRIPTLYTCQGLAEDSPGFQTFKEDMMIQPPWRFYQRRQNPGKGVDAWATSKRGPEGDLQLWAFKKLAEEANVSGILSDGLSIAWADDNPGNAQGGGQPVQITWDKDTPTRTTAQRTFLKRLRGIFNDTGRPTAMSAHTGGGLDPHTLSFFDYYIDGEQLARFPASYQPPLASYAIGYSGQPWGFRGTFWVKRWIRSKGPFHALTYALLHDNEIRDNDLFQEVLKEIGGADSPDVVFHPYWEPNPYLDFRSTTGESHLSLYHARRQALVVVGNTGLAHDTVTIGWERLFADSKTKPTVEVEDLLSGKTFSIENGNTVLSLAPGYCVALRAKADDTVAGRRETAWDASKTVAGWTLSEGGKRGQILDQQQPALVLSSKGSQGREVRATYSAHPLIPAASGEILLLPTDNFRLHLGKSALVWTRNDGWSVEGFRALGPPGAKPIPSDSATAAAPALGRLFTPPLRTKDADGKPRFASLRFSLHDRLLDATLDGQPLARGLQWGGPAANPNESLTLAFSTRDGGELSLAPVTLRSQTTRLYEGSLISSRVIAAPPAPAFHLGRVSPEDWDINRGNRGGSSTLTTLAGHPALMINPGQDRITATLKHTIGDNFSALLRLKELPRRFLLRIGDISLKYDGRWVLEGPMSGWGEGVGPRTADKAASPQPVIAPNTPVTLVMSMRDGILDMVVNNVLLVREVAFDVPRAGNVISIETWAKFPATFLLENFSSMPVDLYSPPLVTHPVQ